jgi:hypothetical protein
VRKLNITNQIKEEFRVCISTAFVSDLKYSPCFDRAAAQIPSQVRTVNTAFESATQAVTTAVNSASFSIPLQHAQTEIEEVTNQTKQCLQQAVAAVSSTTTATG